jgi:hypothetical protein
LADRNLHSDRMADHARRDVARWPLVIALNSNVSKKGNSRREKEILRWSEPNLVVVRQRVEAAVLAPRD